VATQAGGDEALRALAEIGPASPVRMECEVSRTMGTVVPGKAREGTRTLAWVLLGYWVEHCKVEFFEGMTKGEGRRERDTSYANLGRTASASACTKSSPRGAVLVPASEGGGVGRSKHACVSSWRNGERPEGT
jgi:hypothetical protein